MTSLGTWVCTEFSLSSLAGWVCEFVEEGETRTEAGALDQKGGSAKGERGVGGVLVRSVTEEAMDELGGKKL